jgi:PAS domain S-box-containing protein
MHSLERETIVPNTAEVLRPGAMHQTRPPFELTVESAPVGIAHFDFSGRFLYANPQLCALLGLTREQLLTKTFLELSFPDDLPRCLEMNQRLAAGEIPSYRLEKRFTRPNGSLVYTRVMVTIAKGTPAEPSFFIGVVEDLSDQWIADQARRAAEERLELALAASGTAIFRYDIASKALDWSNGLARLTGLVDDERFVTSELLENAIHPEDRPKMLAAFERALTSGVDFEEEVRVLRSDGSVRWISDRGRVTRDESGHPRYLTGACVDVTKRREAEMAHRDLFESERVARGEAERAIALRDEVLAIVAHDLRNPLHAILLGAELLQRSARGMDALIRDLLDATQIKIGHLPIVMAPTSVPTLVDDAVATLASQAIERGLLLATDIAHDVPAVSADRSRIVRVLDNLVGNAMKFTQSGGRITIRARRAGAFVELAVEDTGYGISPAELPHVFERYWQGSAGARQGMGLGLSIVRGLVEAHGGRVDVESRVNEGSSFKFTLPVYQPPEPNA